MMGAELKLPWRKVDGRIRALASIEEALRVLRTRRGIISGMLGRMRDREQSLRTRISSDVSGGRQEKLALRLSEYKDVQRIIGILDAAELSLDKAILRLENVQYYLLITGELAAAVQALRGVGEILDSIPGNLRSVTDELADTLAWITGNASLSEGLAIDGTSGIAGDFDVQDIIDEAIDEVSDLIMKKFETPEPRAVDMDEVSRILGAAKDVGNNRFNETIAGVIMGRRSSEDEREGVAV